VKLKVSNQEDCMTRNFMCIFTCCVPCLNWQKAMSRKRFVAAILVIRLFFFAKYDTPTPKRAMVLLSQKKFCSFPCSRQDRQLLALCNFDFTAIRYHGLAGDPSE
jgi:hypothetical protein